MDGNLPSISPLDLYAGIGTATAPVVVDVRTADQFAAIDRLIPGAVRRSSDDVEDWRRSLPPSRPIVVCDLFQRESRKIVETLRRLGTNARDLTDGFAAWHERGLPTRRELDRNSDKWVTREHPKIDRIACPWLIQRFINPNAEFFYVPATDVLRAAEATGAIPYDIAGVEFTHEGERCSFDTILRIYDITDPPLQRLATIVRGADTSRHDLAPQCGGLFAISLGLSANFPNDYEMLLHGMVMYDALYSWCRSLQAETHNWPSASDPKRGDNTRETGGPR
jgi:rhodanese-related sulfurtransferase